MLILENSVDFVNSFEPNFCCFISPVKGNVLEGDTE